MRVYAAAMLDKSSSSNNVKLHRQFASEFKKILHVPSNAISTKELNTFLFFSAKRNSNEPSSNTLQTIEKGPVFALLKKYYTETKISRQEYLRNKQELRETYQIIEDFMREIDVKIIRAFDSHMSKIFKDIPTALFEIQSKSYIVLWDLSEKQEHRIFLSGFTNPVFRVPYSEFSMNLDELLDKLAILNLSSIFLGSTLTRLRDMCNVLERFKLELRETHYKSNDSKLQTKHELFLRILSAKLSTLQDVDKKLYKLFEFFRLTLEQLDSLPFKNDSIVLSQTISQMFTQIITEKTLLSHLKDELLDSQIQLRDYLDESKHEVKTSRTIEEFKRGLFPIAELSVDLFVEAELLNIWSDFFSADLPYFSFPSGVFASEEQKPTETTQENIISVRGLVKNYRIGKTTVYALRGINLDIKAGEFMAIKGNSGAGKTTLLNCMAGLDTPDYGTVLLEGKNLHTMSDSQKSKARLSKMGFIFQNYALLPYFTARENVALPADLAGLSKDLQNRIESLLEAVTITKQAEQFPAQLSGGQMQRVAIARALTNRPSIVFADEPTGDLDSVTGKQVMELLKKFHEETKTTIVVITHEQDIANYAERQIVLEDGLIKN